MTPDRIWVFGVVYYESIKRGIYGLLMRIFTYQPTVDTTIVLYSVDYFFVFLEIYFQSLIAKMVKSNEKTNTGEGVKSKRGRTVSDDVSVKSLSETSKSVWTMCGSTCFRCPRDTRHNTSLM
jgi:hypothetical protein